MRLLFILMLFDFIWIWPLSSHNSRQFHIKSQRICERNKQQHDLVKSFKISACQKHDFCLKKVHRSSLAFLFIFSGKKTPWDITGNLDLYVYIYILMGFDSLFFFGRWIAVLSALGQWFLYKLMVAVGYFSIAKDSGERGSFLCSTWYKMQS